MNSEESPTPATPAATDRVSLSPFVNEPFPNWEAILSAHDVARVTRRPRWVVLSLTLLGRFPRKRRYHGRGIGWLRSDVVHWLAKDLRALNCQPEQALIRTSLLKQTSLPLECTVPCAVHRSRGGVVPCRRGLHDE
jgi:hypothetical protein